MTKDRLINADCTDRSNVLRELDRRAPDAPFLALGQTIFWDEPMKAGLVMASQSAGSNRRFISGIHDTDYFAKFSHRGTTTGYRALPHNDTTTKGLWSAAGEFSALMGSETVVTREQLLAAGGNLARIQKERPGYLDEATEAWGWRGVVSLAAESKTTAEKPLYPLFNELYDTLQWAIDESLRLISGPHRQESEQAAHRLLAMACRAAEESDGTLAGFYRNLAPAMYGLVAGQPLDIDTTTTTDLLRFNTLTVGQPRFDLVRLFVDPRTRDEACEAYDDAVAGSEIYPLERFGVGAIPFDLFIPGVGRGTLRLGTRGGLVMTPDPVGFAIRQPLRSLEDLAEVIEKRFGPNCVLVGKAVTLLGMLAREFVFAFHEGASGYVPLSRRLHQTLAAAGHPLELNPILRIRYEPWDAMTDCCAWITLPPPLQGPFGVQELSAPSMAVRWRSVATEQRQRLSDLAGLRKPLELIQYLRASLGGPWQCLASEYQAMQDDLEGLNLKVATIRQSRRALVAKVRDLRRQRNEMEAAKGRHWREFMWEKEPSETQDQQRATFIADTRSLGEQIESVWSEWRALGDQVRDLVDDETIERIRERRRNIALEAELTRLRLIREAVIATEGLAKAAHRPSAWWFPLVCPDGTWFRSTMAKAEFRLEELC